MKTKIKFISSLAIALILTVLSCKDGDPITTKSGEKTISAFSFTSLSPAVTATISGTIITAIVPSGTDVTKLAPTITIPAKATITPASGTAQDFSKDVSYTVTAEDGSTQAYKVSVTKNVTAKSSAKKVLTVNFNSTSPAVMAVIDTAANTITALLPAGSDITKLAPTITISDKATISPASEVSQNFTSPITYMVTAEDGTTKTYTMKAATDTYYYCNVRMTAGEDKGAVSENDSSLLNYRTGQVFLLKDGAKNAANIDLILNYYCNLDLNTPITLKNCGVSCGLGKLNAIVGPQNWTAYRIGDIDWITKNEVQVGGIGYGQITLADWNNLAFSADIDARFTTGRKLDQKNDSNTSGTYLVESDNSCVPTARFDKVLYRFISHEGKKGVLRVTGFGKKASGGYFVTLDIKIQK